jgi:hypothetical protein
MPDQNRHLHPPLELYRDIGISLPAFIVLSVLNKIEFVGGVPDEPEGSSLSSAALPSLAAQ